MFDWVSEANSAPASVDFINQTEKADSFIWSFGDGTISRDSSPDHRYLLSGRYKASLTAIEGGKRKTLEKDIIIAPPVECLLQMETSAGEMLIKLYDMTPQHRDNFIKLAEEGFYEGLIFHRVIPRFMIQGGDPRSKNAGPNAMLGSGGPGYTISAEFVDSLLHIKGALAAARTPDNVNPDKRSSGSQFYIVHGQSLGEEQFEQISSRTGIIYSPNQIKQYVEQGGYPYLDGQYTVFGQVIEGIEVIDSIASVRTNRGDRPLEDILIKKIRVIK
ncbi:MAG: PKD domain-containing protein [Saprospiraceae bacterium]|nr:PKD domain-containing protein [Saprospiraceae bacterium]